MIITYHGAQHVKLSLGDTTISYNPVGKTSKKGKITKYGANIALSSMNSPEYNGVEDMAHGSRAPFTVTGPGEYETQSIFIKGVGVETQIGGETKINTLYTFTLDNMQVCFLGSLSKKLSAEVREAMSGADIVFACGNDDKDSLSPYDIYTVAQSLNPKIIIPIGFNQTDFALFLREGGKDGKEQLEKLTIKRKDIDIKTGEVIALIEI
jgi:Beta-lactamase superfamily domain